MSINHEYRIYANKALVWVGRYRNLKNISHWHYDHELVVSEKGEALIHLDQNQYLLKQGECIFLRGQSLHSIISSSDSILYVALFSEKLVPEITDSYCLNEPLFTDKYGVLKTLREIRKSDFERHPFYDTRNNALMSGLIAGIFSQIPIRKQNITQSKVTQQYKNLLYDMDENVRDYSFTRAVGYMHMSEAYFSRFFKKVSGMTFSQYLNHIRVNKAIDLIRQGTMPITEIADECGFDTIRNFNRVFKQITSYTPRTLPEGYVLALRSNSHNDLSFDPTGLSSELMIE
ncbi:MAG: helix-turn-helix transcriptional regulator [Erysipelotrichaceae bacterium]|nr:helix-turn-helix transcriptional regulator [Erysipelotrichaceae bacterium]MBQ1899927.1 helix-turn-helix transcriptional regulator [Erysipelotrichaceae bacterium]